MDRRFDPGALGAAADGTGEGLKAMLARAEKLAGAAQLQVLFRQRESIVSAFDGL